VPLLSVARIEPKIVPAAISTIVIAAVSRITWRVRRSATGLCSRRRAVAIRRGGDPEVATVYPSTIRWKESRRRHGPEDAARHAIQE
jgi:hypothetical protein